MMSKKSHPWIRCTECGAYLDRSEYHTHTCDCERIAAEKRSAEKQAETRQIVADNLRVMEQAMIEWDYA